jgi:hypothetical protein
MPVSALHWPWMGEWYEIGIVVGVGVALGVLAAGIRPRALAAAVVGGALGVAVGFGVGDWVEAVAGLVGGVAGGLGAAPVVAGALRRGGTRLGVALLVAGGAVVAAGLAFVPVLGYLQAVAVPAVGFRVRSKEPDRYAGLRTLAGD